MNPIELDTSLLSLLPPWYREVLDYQQICLTEQQQFEALAEEIVGVADNFFFQTMDERAVGMWEQVFRIVPNPQVESLAFRRTRVLNRISTRPPYNLGFLYQKLDELIGPGEWKVTVDYPNYTLYIKSAAQNQNYATELAFTINRIKPAHIVWVNAPFVRTGLLLSETISSAQRIYNYKLGAWELGRLPFATDGPEGVIKMPETPSIQQALLAGVANFVSGDVASARVNGTVAITGLTKTVEGSELTVTYYHHAVPGHRDHRPGTAGCRGEYPHVLYRVYPCYHECGLEAHYPCSGRSGKQWLKIRSKLRFRRTCRRTGPADRPWPPPGQRWA